MDMAQDMAVGVDELPPPGLVDEAQNHGAAAFDGKERAWGESIGWRAIDQPIGLRAALQHEIAPCRALQGDLLGQKRIGRQA